ncbi:hypothetical protein ABK040_002780 [Willaertia magna]
MFKLMNSFFLASVLLFCYSSVFLFAQNIPTSSCISSKSQWFQSNYESTASSLKATISISIVGKTNDETTDGTIHLKVVEKQGGGTLSVVKAASLTGSYHIGTDDRNFTVSSLVCNPLLETPTDFCTKLTNNFKERVLALTFTTSDCNEVLLAGFSVESFYKKNLLFTASSDPANSCSLTTSTTNSWWLASNQKRPFLTGVAKEDIYLKLEADGKTFTLHQVLSLGDDLTVDCDVSTLHASYKGNILVNNDVSVILTNYTSCTDIQSSKEQCNLCTLPTEEFAIRGIVHWANETCKTFVFSGVFGSYSFSPSSVNPPSAETEITMFIIAVAIIACVLVFLVPFVIIVLRDWKRYREEKLRGGMQQI